MKIRDFVWLLLVTLGFPAILFSQVKVGATFTEKYYPDLKAKKVGIVANNASVVNGRNIVDQLVNDGIKVIRIYSPEHGFRLNADAGQSVDHDVDSATGINVVSLYGSRKKPTREDLAGIDVVVFDIQDVGVWFYTYISTLTYIMESCSENNIPVILLDRPNPNGFYIDGPVLETEFSSFVGMHPVPVVYGMTIGEYALMVNGEGWLAGGNKCDLSVIRMEPYSHRSEYIFPVKPSPNLPTLNSILLYPSLCLFEGTIVSVGRGTPYPFEVYGHPEFSKGNFSFTPQPIQGMSMTPPYENRECFGVDLRDYFQEHPDSKGRINLKWLIEAYRQWEGKPGFFNNYFNLLAGTASLQKQISQKQSEKKIRASWRPGIEKFMKIREKYLLY